MIISDKVRSGKSQIEGYGIMAVKCIPEGSLIVDYSDIQSTISRAEADKRYESGFDHMLQVDEDAFLVTTTVLQHNEPQHVNHSCSPNCGMEGNRRLITIREVLMGEELTFDYAMTESSNYTMMCNCGTSTCRHVITGNDWRIPTLIEKYAGHFSPYIQQKISIFANAK
jgi:SET domain-containing protein